MYSATITNGAAMSHPSSAFPMLKKTSREAWPVKTFFRASDVKGKWGPPVIFSPSRKKGTTRLSSIGVAMKLANITVGAWQRDPSDAIATPHSNTVTPQIGNTPMVIPNAAEKASCFGSAPLKGKQIKLGFKFLRHQHSHNTENGESLQATWLHNSSQWSLVLKIRNPHSNTKGEHVAQVIYLVPRNGIKLHRWTSNQLYDT